VTAHCESADHSVADELQHYAKHSSL
jgi:hypothetical protein